MARALLGVLLPAAAAAMPQSALKTVTVVTGIGGGKQHLPFAMCKWPVWLSAAGFVSEVPGTGSEASELGEDEARPAGFVDPTGFEQLWCPEDLPLPSCHLAVGVVLKVRRDKPCPPGDQECKGWFRVKCLASWSHRRAGVANVSSHGARARDWPALANPEPSRTTVSPAGRCSCLHVPLP